MEKQFHRRKFWVNQGVGKWAKQVCQTVGRFEGAGGRGVPRHNMTVYGMGAQAGLDKKISKILWFYELWSIYLVRSQ